MSKISILESNLVDIRFDENGHIRLFSKEHLDHYKSMNDIGASFLQSLKTFEALADKMNSEFESIESKLSNDNRLSIGLRNQMEILYHDAEKEQRRLRDEIAKNTDKLKHCRSERNRLKGEFDAEKSNNY